MRRTDREITDAAAIAAIPSLAGYATESYVSDYFSTNYTPPDLSSYATISYADAAASNAQAAAIAAIPSLAGYATQSYVADYFATNYTPPDISSYASRSYADAAASNAQAAAIAAIPSLAGYATETYAQNAASSAASDALSAAQAYARDLSWGASEGNTRLVSLDGTIWQDATGTVWQVSYVYGWSGTVIDLQTSAARPITFYYAGKTTTAPTTTSPTDYWSAGAGTNLYFDADMAKMWELWITNVYHDVTNGVWQPEGPPYPTSTATNLSFNTEFEEYFLFYQPVALATNPVDRVLYASASGDAATAERALSIGTPTRWTDATGCVWQVEDVIEGWTSTTSSVQFTSWNEVDSGSVMWRILFTVDGVYAYGYTSPPTGMTSYTLEAGGWQYYETEESGDFEVNFIRPTIPGGITNLVGRVALTNDLPGAITSTISDFAATGTVHAAESSTYSSRLFDASYDSAYDATYLIRESTNAAIAVSSSLVRYALVTLTTPTEWVFSGVEEWFEITSGPDYDADQQGWYLSVASVPQGRFDDRFVSGSADATSLTFTVTDYNEVESDATVVATKTGYALLDRAVNAVPVTGATTLTLPALSHPGKARDFLVRLTVSASSAITFSASDGEIITWDAAGNPSANFAAGTYLYHITEVADGVFTWMDEHFQEEISEVVGGSRKIKPSAIPTASTNQVGGVKVDGTSVTVTNDTISSHVDPMNKMWEFRLSDGAGTTATVVGKIIGLSDNTALVYCQLKDTSLIEWTSYTSYYLFSMTIEFNSDSFTAISGVTDGSTFTDVIATLYFADAYTIMSGYKPNTTEIEYRTVVFKNVGPSN